MDDSRFGVHRGGEDGGKSFDAREEEEAQLARELGVTVRELNGWAPSTVTFDANGDVASVSVSEPRFTLREKALLILSRRKDAEPRGPHGLLISEATDSKNFGRFKVPPPMTDLAAKAMHEAQEAWRKKNGDQAGMEYLLWRVEKKD